MTLKNLYRTTSVIFILNLGLLWAGPIESALDLSTPAGATVVLDEGDWVIDSFANLAGGANDLGDGGFIGNYLRTDQGTETFSLSLSNLSAHTSINLGLHVAQLVSLDPNRDGDLFRIFVDNTEVLQVGLGFGTSGGYYEPFVSNFEINGQSENTNLVDSVRTVSINKTFDEHVYDFGALSALQNIQHSSSTLQLDIIAISGQGFPNEAYAFDNLEIGLVGAVPEPNSMSLLGLGMISLTLLKRRGVVGGRTKL